MSTSNYNETWNQPKPLSKAQGIQQLLNSPVSITGSVTTDTAAVLKSVLTVLATAGLVVDNTTA